MASPIQLEITTPEGVRLKASADELTIPSVQGEFGVLPGHLPVLAGLKTGIVRVRANGETKSYAVGPGFAQISGDRASILTDKFLAQGDVDPIVARKELKEAEEALAQASTSTQEADLLPAIARARWAAVRLELYGDPPPATMVMALETRLLGHEDYSVQLAQADRAADHTEHAGEVKA